MSIKANELRIGNWVKFKPDTFNENIPFIIESIDIDGCDGFTLKNDATIYKLIKQLHPIPLTPEILEKAGFDWSIYHQAFHKENFGFDLNECYPKGFKLMTFKKVVSIAPNIFSLHQLQNLYFALTGEELIVKF